VEDVARVGEERCVQKFRQGNINAIDHLEDLGTDKSIIFHPSNDYSPNRALASSFEVS
jgi:hypothetical protein